MPACTSCNLCDSPGTLYESVDKARIRCHVRHFADDLFTVWRCANCNSLHSAEDADLALFYAHYPLRNHKLDFVTRILYGNRLRLLQRQGLRRADRILDYGCGAGAFVEFLKGKGYQNTFGYDAFIAAYTDRQVLRERFDAVVSYDVIEHVDDPRQLLSELRDLARPQGLIVVGTPNADHLSVRGNSPDIELSQPYHRHILSRRTLLDLGQKIGLRPVHFARGIATDSLIPGVNTRFMWAYIKQTGGMIDVGFEPIRLSLVLRSPALWFYAFFGYFFPPRGNMVVIFSREDEQTLQNREDRERGASISVQRESRERSDCK